MNSKKHKRPSPGSVAEQECAHLLTAMGYAVSRIGECQSPRCDFRATKPEEDLWVEVKSLNPGAERLKALRQQREVHQHAVVEKVSGLEDLLDEAANQIAQSAPAGSIRLIWVSLFGPGDLGKTLQLFCTLYGIRWFRIVSGQTHGGANVIPAFLADRCWFADHREVAAVLVNTPGGVGLRLNPFNKSPPLAREPELWSILRSVNAVFDLRQWAQAGLIHAVDPDQVNAGRTATLCALQAKYTFLVEPFVEHAHSVAWPGNEQGSIPIIPGADQGVALFALHAWLLRKFGPTRPPV